MMGVNLPRRHPSVLCCEGIFERFDGGKNNTEWGSSHSMEQDSGQDERRKRIEI